MKHLMATVLIGFSLSQNTSENEPNYFLAPTSSGASFIQSSKPAYLNQFPSLDQIKADVRGVDAMETAAKQAGIFWQLRQLIYDLAYSQRRTDRQFTPDEQRMEIEYRNAHYKAIEPFEGKVSGADKPKWFELRGKYEMDLWLRDEVFKKYFTPDLRRAVYVALKGEMPTTNAPEQSRLTAPLSSSTASANPRATSAGTGTAARPSPAAAGRLYYDASGNWKYKDDLGGVYDKNGYTWADGSLTTNSRIQVKADQPYIVDYGDGTKTDLRKELGRSVTLQEARQFAINGEESLQAMGYSQPNTPEAIIAKFENRSSGSAPATETTPSKPSQPSASARASAESYKAQGDKSFDAKNFANAIEAYKRAITIDPSYAKAYIGLAISYLETKQWQLAVAAFQKSQTLGMTDAFSLLLLGGAHRELKQFDEALKVFRSVIELQPEAEALASAHYEMGTTYWDMGQYQNAVSAFETALRIDPNDANAHRELGLSYYGLRQYPKALAAVQEAIRLNPKNASSFRTLGYIYVKMGKRQEAMQAYRTLLTLNDRMAQQLFAEINKMK